MARWTLLRHCLNDWESFLYRARKICLLRIHALILGVTQGRSPWWARVRVSGKNRSIASQMTLLKWANLSKQEFSEKNPKYHYSYLFFFTINKGDLPLMYSCAFWCEFIDLVVFFLAVIVWPLSHSSYYEESMNTHQKTQEYIKGNSPLFIS